MKTEKYNLNKTTLEADDESYWEYEEYRDTSATPYSTDYSTFELKAVAEPYTDIFYPHDAYVELHVKLVKTDGAAYTDNDDVALINPASSIFTNVEYSINDINVEGELLQHTHIPNLVNGLIHYDEHYAKSMAQSYGWAMDTGTTAVADTQVYNVTGSFRRGRIIEANQEAPDETLDTDLTTDQDIADEINGLRNLFVGSSVFTYLTTGPIPYPGDPILDTYYGGAGVFNKDDQNLYNLANRALKVNDNPTYNSGFAFRKSQTLNSKVKVYKIPLRELVPFVKGNNMIWSGCDLTLKLNKEDENITIFRAAGVDAGKIQIHKISLWMPKLKVKESYKRQFYNLIKQPMQHELMWNSNLVFIKYTTGKYFNDVIYKTKQKVSSVFVLIQPNVFHQTTNFSVTDATVNFRRAHVQIGNTTFPARPYSLNYDNNIGPVEYTRMYHTLLKIAGKSFTDDVGMQLTYETFGSYYRMLCFDIDSVPDDFYNKDQTISLRFETENNMDHNVYVLVNFEKTCDLTLDNGHMGVTNVRK